MTGKAPDDSEILDMLNASERRKHTIHELAARVTAHYGVITEISKDLFQIQEEAREIDYQAFWDLLDDNGKLCLTGFSAALNAGPSADPAAALDVAAAQIRYSHTFNHGAPPIPPAVPPPTVQRFTPYMRDDRMRTVLERLFAESAKLHSIPAGESPALECQIVIRNGPTMVGALSMTSEGLLRFLAAAQDGRGAVAMLESFFDIADLVSVIVQRTAPAAPQPESRIFQG